MTGLLDPGTGMERIARETLVVLMDGLNEELDRLQDEWADDDEELALRRGEEPYLIELEHVAPQNFYLGNVPSLAEDNAPQDRYPNVAVMAYRSGPAATDDGDHYSERANAVYVETMVKAAPDEGEEVCDRRIWRTAEAIHNVLQRDGTFNGYAYDTGPTPTCLISEVFTRPINPRESSGARWFWQAARIEYTVSKYSPFE